MHHQLHPIGNQGGDPIPMPQPQPPVSPGQPLHLAVEIGPADAAAEILKGRRRRIGPQALLQQAVQVDRWGQGRAVVGHRSTPVDSP